MKKCILLVDDDMSVLQSLARVVEAEHYAVLTARNGREALDTVAAEPVDLVMLDLTMPVKDGWQTFEGLTRDYPLLPVIIITARSNQLFPALAAGVGALMEKPLDFPKLLRTIRDLLDEPTEARLARIAGKLSQFRYVPSIAPA
jgi:DNA-binding response OmpR family regulator